MPDIPLHDLSDRDLLVLTAQRVNDIAEDHEKRLRWIEKEAWAVRGAIIFIGGWLRGKW